jgi:hypothetical protein
VLLLGGALVFGSACVEPNGSEEAAAATLASYLGVKPPSSAVGMPLEEVLP